MNINESLLATIKVYFFNYLRMLLAAVTAGLSIKLSLALFSYEVDYLICVGVFLSARVILFMANPPMPLTIPNVQFMSEQRILWNLATIAILAPMYLLKLTIF